MEKQTLFGNHVSKRMEELGIGIKEVSDRTEATYEHVRRIVRGTSFPSPFYMAILCNVLGLNLDDMNKLLTADRIQARYGDLDEVQRFIKGLSKTA